MAKAEKTKSGAYRCRPTKTINGKKVTKCFTVHPDECRGDARRARDLCEKRAREWALNINDTSVLGLTVGGAIENYIDDRSKVLSPSSIATYKQFIQYFDSISNIYVEDLDTATLQRLINDMALDVSCKTIKSRMGFLLSVLNYCEVEKRFRLRYPQAKPSTRKAPDYDVVSELLKEADEIIKPVICLAAFGTLRRGEISALKQKDISRGMRLINIHANMVRTPNNTFVYKDIPKTEGSVRSVALPKAVIDLLPRSDDPEAFVFDLSPTAITRRFEKLRDSLGVKCTFHDLRHFAASFRADIGIPKKFIEESGGWLGGSSKVLDTVYINTLTSSRKKYNDMTDRFIEEKYSDVLRIKRQA